MNFETGSLWNRDCLSLMRRLDPGSVHAVIADPPFSKNERYLNPEDGADWRWSEDREIDFRELQGLNPAAWHAVASVLLQGGGGGPDEALRGLRGTTEQREVALCVNMAVNFIEMWRILHKTGYLFVFCDQRMLGSFQQILDGIAPGRRFATIVYRRSQSSGMNAKNRFRNDAEMVLVYRKKKAKFKQIIDLHPDGYYAKFIDGNGEIGFVPNNMVGGYAGPNGEGRFPVINPATGAVVWPPEGRVWAYSESNIEEMLANGELLFRGNSIYYAQAPTRGRPRSTIWLPPETRNRDGSTEKNMHVLRELIHCAALRPGAVVFDPFMANSGILSAARGAGLEFIGCHRSEESVREVEAALEGDLFHRISLVGDLPVPTGIETMTKNEFKRIRGLLYGALCEICYTRLPGLRHMEADHILASSRGGLSTYDNFQLACGHCNRRKGQWPQKRMFDRMDYEERRAIEIREADEKTRLGIPVVIGKRLPDRL